MVVHCCQPRKCDLCLCSCLVASANELNVHARILLYIGNFRELVGNKNFMEKTFGLLGAINYVWMVLSIFTEKALANSPKITRFLPQKFPIYTVIA